MSNSTPTETLRCASCKSDFTRERKRGVKPKNCPTCTTRLADEAKETAASEAKLQQLHCESCDKNWTRPAQRGKPPKRCPSCSPTPVIYTQQNKTFVSVPKQVAAQVDGVLDAISGHYTVARLLKEREDIPVEERYKFAYIESQLALSGDDARSVEDQKALKRVWATLEGGLR